MQGRIDTCYDFLDMYFENAKIYFPRIFSDTTGFHNDRFEVIGYFTCMNMMILMYMDYQTINCNHSMIAAQLFHFYYNDYMTEKEMLDITGFLPKQLVGNAFLEHRHRNIHDTMLGTVDMYLQAGMVKQQVEQFI